jgi:hypothetical protein
MSSAFQPELAEFHHFLGQQLAAGTMHLSPEEALDEWRLAHPSPETRRDDVAAVREALADMAAGDRGKSLADFYSDFDARHGLASS